MRVSREVRFICAAGLFALAALALLALFIFWGIAIWTKGDDSMRWGSMAGLSFFAALVFGVSGGATHPDMWK